MYGGQPDAATGSVYDLLFDEGVRMGSWGLLLHSITACLYAVFFQDYVTKMIGLKRSYQLGVGIFSISMAVTVLNTSSLTCLNLAAAASGAMSCRGWVGQCSPAAPRSAPRPLEGWRGPAAEGVHPGGPTPPLAGVAVQ